MTSYARISIGIVISPILKRRKSFKHASRQGRIGARAHQSHADFGTFLQECGIGKTLLMTIEQTKCALSRAMAKGRLDSAKGSDNDSNSYRIWIKVRVQISTRTRIQNNIPTDYEFPDIIHDAPMIVALSVRKIHFS
jgi:hypothetical protein